MKPLTATAAEAAAFLAGAKTEWRHPMKGVSARHTVRLCTETGFAYLGFPGEAETGEYVNGPFRVGERYWVQERWQEVTERGNITHYGPFQPAATMPQWASRIVLECTGLRAEQIHMVNEAEALAEGFSPSGWWTAKGVFFNRWAERYGLDFSWTKDPTGWVWVPTFKVVQE